MTLPRPRNDVIVFALSAGLLAASAVCGAFSSSVMDELSPSPEAVMMRGGLAPQRQWVSILGGSDLCVEDGCVELLVLRLTDGDPTSKPKK